MNSEPAFKSIFINEFRPGNSTEQIDDKIVYHYTSANAFLSILREESIRFSDIRYMNDRSETVFCAKRLIEFVTEYKENYPFFRDAVNELLSENAYDQILKLNVNKIIYKEFSGFKIPRQRTFIFCTSEDADSLNMWNYYASNGMYTGYNIGLSVKDFLKTFDVEETQEVNGFIVFYGHVLYTKKKQFNAIEELAQTIENFSSYGKTEQHKMRAAIAIRQYIELRGPFFKDNSFKSENEYRFLISIAEKRIPHNNNEAQKYFGQYNKKLCEGFCERRGLIVPYMQVAIPENSINRITMSPMMEYEIAKSSIKELLKIKGIQSIKKTEVPIHKSRIPIRF